MEDKQAFFVANILKDDNRRQNKFKIKFQYNSLINNELYTI